MSEQEIEDKHVLEQLADDGTGTGIEVVIDDENEVDITEPFDPKQIDIKSRAYSIEQVLNRIEHDEVLLTPDFQRQASIWKHQQMSRLIESILLKIPLPMFYLSTDEDDNWLVVDGLQRITTILEYVVEEKWPLTGLEFLFNYDGCKYSDLPRPMQRRINETELFMHIIQPGTPKEVTRTIFRRINTGGLALSAQEIRHALYQGKSTNLLSELVEEKAYRDATTSSIKDDRMAGRESCLRFLAFFLTPHTEYTNNNLDEFLSNTMHKINHMEDGEIETLKNKFCQSMNRNKTIFGKYAFRKRYGIIHTWRYPINKALFEIWSVTLAHLSDQEFNILKKRKRRVITKLAAMLNGTYKPDNKMKFNELEKRISLSTNSQTAVHLRFEAIYEIVQSTLDEEAEKC